MLEFSSLKLSMTCDIESVHTHKKEPTLSIGSLYHALKVSYKNIEDSSLPHICL